MAEYFASLTGMEKIYLGCAVFGGGMFVIRMVLMLLGAGDTDMDTDAGADVDLDAHADTHFDIDHGGDYAGDHVAEHVGIDEGLRLLSVQGITAFVMMFGLTGYAVSRSTALGSLFTLAVGGGVGLVGMWIVAKGFSVMNRLQSSGNINIYDAMGEEGTVYLRIPAEGTGKVTVTVSGRLMVMDAVSHDRVDLQTGDRVSVAEVINGRLMSVRKL